MKLNKKTWSYVYPYTPQQIAERPCLYNNSIIGYSCDSDDYSAIA